MTVTKNAVQSKVQITSLKDMALLLEKCDVSDALVLSKNRFLIYDLIVDAWQVVGKIQNPDRL